MIGCNSFKSEPSVRVCDIFDKCKKRKFIENSNTHEVKVARLPIVLLEKLKLEPDQCPNGSCPDLQSRETSGRKLAITNDNKTLESSCEQESSAREKQTEITVTNGIKTQSFYQEQSGRERLTETTVTNVIKSEPSYQQESVKWNQKDVKATKTDIENDQVVSSSSDDDEEGVSEYEKMRLKNIKDNAKFFASLNIFTAKEQLTVAVKGPKKASKPRIPKEKEIVIPRKPSLRLRRQGPDGQPLPPKPVIRYIDEVTRREERKPAGPIRMLATNLPENIQENSPTQVKEMLHDISYDEDKCAEQSQSDLELDTFCQPFSKMRLKPERVAKVTKERVYSVAIHPGQDKVLVCAGDKSGRLGMWDVESRDKETNDILMFEPHSSPVNCLHFAPANPSKIYSSSYDGTIRCGDFQKGVFDEAYATALGMDIYISHFDFLSPDGSKLVAAQNDGEGHIAIVDTRTRCGAENVYKLHDKSIRTVSVHPLKNNYIVTGSKDGTVALWDTRSLKTKGKNKSIASLSQGRSVTGAYFSPLAGRKVLTTSYNDTLKVYTFSDNGAVFLKTTVRHNNFTGRWVTPFRAVWHPSRDDVFISGSMERPRRIEVYNDKGVILKNFMDEDCLGSICSINAFHPHRNILVGGNSSGRLHVFM